MEETAYIKRDAKGNIYPGKPIPPEYAVLQLPGFDFLSLLGIGGMGAVFLARQKSLDRLVAVKVLKLKYMGNSVSMERFNDEAKTMAALSHKNILACYDIIPDADKVFLVMQYIPGHMTTRDLVSRFGAIKEQTVLRLLIDIIDGLEYMQSKGYSHYDIKPSNLMIFREGQYALSAGEKLFDENNVHVVIGDFGIARHVSQLHDIDNQAIGSPMYMAPEQFCQDAELDFRADIYSLGSTLYFLLCRAPAYGGSSSAEDLTERKLNEPFPDPRKQNHSLSKGISRIILKMCALLPEDRYQSYSELRADVMKLMSGNKQWLIASGIKIPRIKMLIYGVLIGLLVIVPLEVGWFYRDKIILYFHHRNCSTSLAARANLWKDYDIRFWRFIPPDASEKSYVIQGRGTSDTITLTRSIYPGWALTFKTRFNGDGTARFSIVDINKSTQNATLECKRLNSNEMEFFLIDLEGHTSYIGSQIIESWKEWHSITFSMKTNSIIITLDKTPIGVIHSRSAIQDSRFSTMFKGPLYMELKDIYLETDED